MTLSRAFDAIFRVLRRLLIILTHPVAYAFTLQNGRKTLVRMAYWAHNNRRHWDYSQQRPVRYRLFPRFRYDCSGGVCWVYRCAGLRDPSGNVYSGSNTNTESLLARGRRISPFEVLPGDVCILGRELPIAEQHAMMAVEKGPDPLCFSHGEQGGPDIVRAHVDPRSHTWVRFDVLRIHRIRWPQA